MTVAVVDPGAGDLSQPIEGRPYPDGPPSVRVPKDLSEFAQRVNGRWAEATDQVAAARRSYWINLAFYLGQHWTWWSAQRNLLMPYPRQIAPLGNGRVRLTVNRFGPNVLNVWNRMMRSELAFEVPPSDSSDPIVQGAKRAEKLLESKRVTDGWDAIRADELLATILGGTSAVMVEWDGTGGHALPQYVEGEDQYVGTGDATLRPLNINEFGLEPGVRRFSDAGWCIMGLALPCATVREQYGLSWMPRPDAGTAHTPLYDTLLDGSGRNRGRNLCLVLCYYERPTRGKRGAYGVVVNGHTVYKSEWPFEFDDLNFTLFRQKQIDGRAIGATYLDDAIAVQTAYNHARSVLAEHMKLAGNAKLIAPFGSIDEEDLHGSAGDIIWFSPDATGGGPSYLAPPNLPRWLTAEADTLAEELDNIMHVHDISRGVGFSRASGQALSFLAEQDDSALGHMVFEQKHGWQRIAKQVLTLYSKRATETREAPVRLAPGITDNMRWTGRELMGQTDVVVPTEAVTPKNAAARLANAKDLWDRKIITDPRRYARMVGLPPDEFGQLLDPDAELANNENLRMMLGQAVVPNDFDDHAVHIAEHNDRLRKTDAYLFAPQALREIVDDHIKYHENKAANEFAKQKALAAVNPAAATVPQADAPDGSAVPMGEQEAQGRLAALAQLGGTPGGGTAPGGAPPAGGSQQLPSAPMTTAAPNTP